MSGDTTRKNDQYTYDQMSDDEGLNAIKAGLHDVDKLLNQLSSCTFSKYSCDYTIRFHDSKTSIIDKATLGNISIPMKKGFDIDAFQKILSQISSNSKKDNSLKLIPLSVLGQGVESYALNTISADLIKETLINYNIVLSIHRSGGIVLEVPFVDDGFHTGEIDECTVDIALFSADDLRNLKKSNLTEWQSTMSILQYRRVKQQVYQVVSTLDLQLDKPTIDQIAERIISIAVAWSRSEYFKTFAVKALETLFGGNDAGKFIFSVDDDYNKMRMLRCLVSSSPWEDYCGIGVDIEAEIR